jgi:hypothetical protein
MPDPTVRPEPVSVPAFEPVIDHVFATFEGAFMLTRALNEGGQNSLRNWVLQPALHKTE